MTGPRRSLTFVLQTRTELTRTLRPVPFVYFSLASSPLKGHFFGDLSDLACSLANGLR